MCGDSGTQNLTLHERAADLQIDIRYQSEDIRLKHGHKKLEKVEPGSKHVVHYNGFLMQKPGGVQMCPVFPVEQNCFFCSRGATCLGPGCRGPTPGVNTGSGGNMVTSTLREAPSINITSVYDLNIPGKRYLILYFYLLS